MGGEFTYPAEAPWVLTHSHFENEQKHRKEGTDRQPVGQAEKMRERKRFRETTHTHTREQAGKQTK